AQILDLLAKLQAERSMAILLITHDLGVVARMAQRVAVMYAGEIVEVAERAAFFAAPQHPYSQKLFQALPSPDKRGGELSVIAGQVPPLTGGFTGCRFADRCEFVYARCREDAPRLIPPAGAGGEARLVRCHLREQGLDGARPGAKETQEETQIASASAPVIAQLEDLQVYFPIRRGLFKRTVGYVKAVD